MSTPTKPSIVFWYRWAPAAAPERLANKPVNFGYRHLGLACLRQVNAVCRGHLAYSRLQGGFREFLEGLSRLPHIDAVDATVLLVVDMHDRARGQLGVNAHLVRDGIDHLDRESGRENKLSKDGHDWLPSGRGRSAPGEDRPSRFPWPSLVATARQGHSSEGAAQ